MKASDFNTSNYLNAKTAGQYNGTHLKIYEVKQETIRDKNKMVIGFEGVEKLMVINRTNREALAEAFGDEDIEKAWIGKSVLVSIQSVMFEGKRTPSIFLTPDLEEPQPTAAKKPKK